MFSSSNLWVMLASVLIALFFVIGSSVFVYKMFAKDTKEILVRFILIIFTALTALYIVDKIIAFKIELMSEEQSGQLFDLIRTLVLMIFSYYFGTKEK